MNSIPASTEKLRILIACARPLAARIRKLVIELEAVDRPTTERRFASLLSFIREDLKLTPIHVGFGDSGLEIQFSIPFPNLDYLQGEIEKLEGVVAVSHQTDSKPIDVFRPGEDLDAVLKGIEGLGRAVQVDVLHHATPEEIHACLNSGHSYQVLHLVCHRNPFGAVLLEDGRGWVRYVGSRELADMLKDRVQIFVNGACHGERSIASLKDSKDGRRPPSMIFVTGGYTVPSRAIHLFAEDFYRGLVKGNSSIQAFENGIERVRRDDHVGEVSVPDGSTNDFVPSPFKRIEKDELKAVVFRSISAGEVEVRDLLPPKPLHRKILRPDDIFLGREIEVASVIEELLPPMSGLIEKKYRLVHLHGEGGIGKTRLAQTVCDTVEDYRLFSGGIFEVDCEREPDCAHLAMAILRTVGVERAEAIKDPILALPEVFKEISKNGDVLLMLDTCDRLFGPEGDELDPDPAMLLKTVFSECPAVRVLSTCRTKLGFGGYECDFLVDPLTSQISLNLFYEYITDSDLQKQVAALEDEPRGHLEHLIRLLDGHPLSIFLAAQRIALSSKPIEKQIEEADRSVFELLEVQRLRGVPARQRSIRVSLDLSYIQLSDEAKSLFQRASMFPTGLFRNVNTLDDLLGGRWRDAAQEAMEFGLLRFDLEAQRYWMLNPIREYAEARLDSESCEFRKAVAQHWAKFTTTQDFLLNPAQNAELLSQLELPSNIKERRQRIEEFHDRACNALQSEESNILYAFQWALKNDFQSAEIIATGMIDYLTIYDKRQTNAWIAKSTEEACGDQRSKDPRGKPRGI